MRVTTNRSERLHRLQLIFAFGVLQLIVSWLVLLFITQNIVFLHPLVTNLGAVHAWTVLVRSRRVAKVVRTVAAVSAFVGLLISFGVILGIVSLEESLFDAGLIGSLAVVLLMTNIFQNNNGRERADPLDRSLPRGTVKG